jgi:hypothetical protein
MESPSRRVFSLLLGVAAAGLAGCLGVTGPRLALEPAVRADPWQAPSWLGGGRFQEGDLILTRFADVSAAIQTLHTPHGRYGHSMLVMAGPDGAPMIVQMHVKGLETLPLQEHLARYARAVVLRRREADPAAAARLRAAVENWISRARRERIRFAMSGAGPTDGSRTLNCVTLLNLVHEEAGLPAPFVVRRPRAGDAWTAAAGRLAGVDLRAMPMPADALDHPDWEPIAAGHYPDHDARWVAVQDEIADAIRGQVLAGRHPRPPRPGERLWFAMTGAVVKRDATARELLAVRATLLDFARTVEEPLADYLRRHPAAAEDTVRRLARRRIDDVLRRYFVGPASP